MGVGRRVWDVRIVNPTSRVPPTHTMMHHTTKSGFLEPGGISYVPKGAMALSMLFIL